MSQRGIFRLSFLVRCTALLACLACMGGGVFAQQDDRLAALLTRHVEVSKNTDVALLGQEGSITAVRVLENTVRQTPNAKLAKLIVDQLGLLIQRATTRESASEALATAALRAKNDKIRRLGADLLAKGKGTREALRTVFRDSREHPLRVVALRGMVAQGSFDEELRRLCGRALFNPEENGGVRVTAFRAPAFQKTLGREELFQLCADENSELRFLALHRLRETEARVATALAKDLLNDRVAKVQIEAGNILIDSAVPVNLLAVLDQVIRANAGVRRALQPRLSERASSAYLSGIHARLADPEVKDHASKVLSAVLGDLAAKKDAKALQIARKLLRHPQVFVRIRIAKLLGDAGDRGSIAALSRLLKSAVPAVRIEGMRALVAIQGKNPQLAKDIFKQLDDEDEGVRVAAVDTLAQMGHSALGAEVVPMLKDDSFSVRLAAMEAIVRLRYKPGIPALIEGLERSHGRFEEDFARALRMMTNQPFRRHAPDWRRWWADHAEIFEPPPLDEATLQELAFRKRAREVGSTSSFYGLEILSDRVVFVIDQSGSMNAKAGTRSRDEKAKTRLQVAKEELQRYLKNVTEQDEFNIVLFGTGVKSWQDKLTPPKGGARENAQEWVRKIGLQGATNLYGGLKRAFSYEHVDTIYLLTDGDPTVGEEVDPGIILEDVEYWNRERRILIHSISIGKKSKLLEALAEQNGGEYIVR